MSTLVHNLAGRRFGKLVVVALDCLATQAPRLRFVLINQRIGRGWSLERAVSQKPRGEAVLSC